MDFVTITDHDSIDGVMQLLPREDVFVGEELTCWFPEDRCKLHLLLYGITPRQHADLQGLASSVYSVADYVEKHRIAHSLAHPIYRQNDRLERWHLERLLLLFKGFECLNGAHSALHREAFEPVLDALDREKLLRLSAVHGIEPRWPEPWIKSRTAGSDDHGLLNIGRTWTEFPPEVSRVEDLLDCLRTGRCRPAGEAGSSLKLAHTFYSVGVRYYTRQLLGDRPSNLPTQMLQALVGDAPVPGKLRMIGGVLKSRTKRAWSRLTGRGPATHKYGTHAARQLFVASALRRFRDHPELLQAASSGLPPLGEHESFFDVATGVNRDVTEGLAQLLRDSLGRDASLTGLFDTIGAVLAQQFLLLPYYFAVFHQNKERDVLRRITRVRPERQARTLRVGLFTDTLDEINGVARFIADIGQQASRAGRNLVIHTASPANFGRIPENVRRNFRPLLTRELPYYPQLNLALPPVLEVLEWADRQQFDIIHASTPGPMGLCGWLCSRMLRAPFVGTYHTDFPAYVDSLTHDHRLTRTTRTYMQWFYGQMGAVFARSSAYHLTLQELGVASDRLRRIVPGIDTAKFHPGHRDERWMQRIGADRPRRLLYAGRVSVEKNLPMLVEIFRAVATRRSDVVMIVAGDGPYLASMKEQTGGLPVLFPGMLNDSDLATAYATSDLLVFPSRTDTLGQVVMEAQASGLPALVTMDGGPREQVEDGVTGLVLSGSDPKPWVDAIGRLLDDETTRQAMSHAAARRMAQFTIQRSFEGFWEEHLELVKRADRQEDPEEVPSAIAGA